MAFNIKWLFADDATRAERVIGKCELDGSGVACCDDEAAGVVIGVFYETHDGGPPVPVRIVYRNFTPNRHGFTTKALGPAFDPEGMDVEVWGTPKRTPLDLILNEPLGTTSSLAPDTYVAVDFAPDPETTIQCFQLIVTPPNPPTPSNCPCCS